MLAPRSKMDLIWLVRDTLSIAQRDLLHWRQQPTNSLINWVFPVMIVLIFGGLFGGAMRVPQGSSYFTFLIPGMFTLTMFFGLEGTRVAMVQDSVHGIMDRFRSLPINSSAVVLGRCLADLLHASIGLLLLILAGLLLGWRWNLGLPAALVGFGLLLLLRFALLWIGIFIGLNQRSLAVSPLQMLTWPLSFVSNIFVDPETMPGWLGAIAAWNPLSATAAAARQLFGNPAFPSESWATEYAILLACLWPLGLIAIFLPLSAQKLRNLDQ